MWGRTNLVFAPTYFGYSLNKEPIQSADEKKARLISGGLLFLRFLFVRMD